MENHFQRTLFYEELKLQACLVVVVVEGLKEKKIEPLLEDPVVVVLGGIFLVDNFASSHMLTIPNEHG